MPPPRWRPTLEDYVDVAAFLLTAPPEAVRNLPRMGSAESAIHAPFASVDPGDLVRGLRVPRGNSAREIALTREQQRYSQAIAAAQAEAAERLTITDKHNPYKSVLIRGRFVDEIAGDAAIEIMDRMSNRYVAPTSRCGRRS